MIALVATLFAGCVKDRVNELSVDSFGKKIHASIEPTESRVQLDVNKHTVWNADDKIVLYEDGACSVLSFDGKTGDRSGTFTVQKSFNANIQTNGAHYALYSCDNQQFMAGSWSDGTLALFATVPAEQNYLADSYGLNSNILLGASDDGENFSFKNLLGYLRLAVVGEKRVDSIELMNNSGGAVAGLVVLMVTDVDFWQLYDSPSSSITLNCGEGVQLSSSPVNFYFAMLPTMLEEGISVNIHFTDGTSFIQNTNNAITIERNVIQPMAVINTDIDESDYKRVLIHHTNRLFVTPLVEGYSNGSIDWGDGNVSLLNEFSSYEYTDNATSHIITIKAIPMNSVILPTMKGVTKLDLSNF